MEQGRQRSDNDQGNKKVTPMNYCQTADRRLNCDLRMPRLKTPDFRQGLLKAGYCLRVIVSPESSQDNRAPDYVADTPWLGPVKALFWAAASVGIGVLLAVVCS